MATATNKARTATQGNGDAIAASKSLSMQFLIFEDNADDYYWTLIDGARESLA